MLSTALRIFGILLITVLTFHSYGQNWSVYLEDETIKIEFASLHVFADSLVGEQLIFKYSNKTDDKIRLKFVRREKHSGSGRQSKQKFKLELAPNEVVQGKLTDGVKECSVLQLFVGWKHDEKQIESFRIEKVDHSILK